MKTIAIKVKNYAGNVSIVNNNNLSSRVLNILLWSLGTLSVCYVIFLGTMVFNIIERKALEMENRTLTNDVADLESQYFTASNKIDLNLAVGMGFKETQKAYAVREPIGSLKMISNEL